MNLFDKPTSI